MKKSFGLLKSSLLLSLNSFLGPLCNFLLLPIYASKLSSADYGIASLCTSIQVILVIFSGLVISSSISINFAKLNFKEFRCYFCSTLIFKVLAGLALLAFMCCFGDQVLNLIITSRKVSFYNTGLYVTLIVFITNIISHFTSAIFIQQRIWLFSSITWISVILNMALSILLIYFLEFGYDGIFLSNLISSAVQLLIVVIYSRDLLTSRFDINYIYSALQFSLPLVPHRVGVFVYALSDKFILEHSITVAAVGLYSMSDKFANISKLIIKASNQSLRPHFYSKIQEEGEGHAYSEYKKSSSKWLLVNSTIVMFISLFCEEAIEIMTPEEYHESWKFVSILCYSHLCTGLGGILFLGFSASFKNKYISFISIFCGIINIVMNLALIPVWGIWAAVWSTFASSMLSLLISMYFSNKNKLIKFETTCVTEIFSSSAFVVFCASQIEFSSWSQNLLSKITLLSVYIGYILLRNIAGIRQEIATIYSNGLLVKSS